MAEIRDCVWCEGLGFRTVSVEQENGYGLIQKEECEVCKGKGYAEIEDLI